MKDILVEPTRFAQEHVETLRDGGLWGSGKAKLIRFIVLQAISVTLILVTGGYSFITSLGLGTVDSFLSR